MFKGTFKEASIILLIVLAVGIIYNLSLPNKLPFLAGEKAYDFSKSDSLLLALQKQDSVLRVADSLKRLSLKRDDSLRIVNEKKAKDSLLMVAKQDSIKHISDSLKIIKKKTDDSLNAVKEKEQEFVKPVDIRLDFAKALFGKKYKFIDSRDEADYSAGTIQGAVNYPYHKFDQIKDKISKLPKNEVYVCFCSSACDVSVDMAYAMAHMGFTKMYIFHGGWDEWKKAGYPTN